jgi:5-methylcytosine-specific restriction protein B
VLWMEPGQLVFVSDGMSKLKAIGEVSGDYFCDPSSSIRYAQFRKVKWLYKDLALPIEEIYGKKFSQQTIYQIDPKQINQSFFSKKNLKKKDALNYVLIIDEINRGNVSSIFGELITLIEPDKRKGEPEELAAVLPYSKTTFSVPNNLHILGTMNTADRSVEALDTALRRRFSFEEMLPNPGILDETIASIKLSELLTVLNDRIEVLVDRDHTIGHAFFINDKNLDDLRNTFANKVIPLLQEYFYGDYGKMEMVIGSAFFEVKDTTKVKFAVKPEDFDPEGKVYHIVDVADKKTMSDDDFKEALTKLIKGA